MPGFDRVCQINTISKTGNENGVGFTGPQVRQLRQAAAVEDVVAESGWNLIITGNDVPEDVYRSLPDRKCLHVFWNAGDSGPLLPALRRAR